jgi:catechol 2,3-dioxygenase-like lactoylglutathione lyase family enzyme
MGQVNAAPVVVVSVMAGAALLAVLAVVGPPPQAEHHLTTPIPNLCGAAAWKRMGGTSTPRVPHGHPKEGGGQMTMPTPAEWSFGATIPAKDLDRTRRFYEDVLGAQAVTEDPGGIIYRSGDSYFSLYPTEFAGTAQHTLGAFMVRDVEATVADLRGKGVTFEDYDQPGLKTVNGIADLGGIRGAWFKDPEGNILSVVQLPAS